MGPLERFFAKLNTPKALAVVLVLAFLVNSFLLYRYYEHLGDTPGFDPDRTSSGEVAGVEIGEVSAPDVAASGPDVAASDPDVSSTPPIVGLFNPIVTVPPPAATEELGAAEPDATTTGAQQTDGGANSGASRVPGPVSAPASMPVYQGFFWGEETFEATPAVAAGRWAAMPAVQWGIGTTVGWVVTAAEACWQWLTPVRQLLSPVYSSDYQDDAAAPEEATQDDASAASESTGSESTTPEETTEATAQENEEDKSKLPRSNDGLPKQPSDDGPSKQQPKQQPGNEQMNVPSDDGQPEQPEQSSGDQQSKQPSGGGKSGQPSGGGKSGQPSGGGKSGQSSGGGQSK